MARPTKYRAEFADQAEKICKLGGVDAELADFFSVSEFTINKWKHAHKPFRLALIAGKQAADAQIAERLYQRACGYSHPAVKIFQHEGEIIEAPYRKQFAPDTVACIFWLKNRRPDLWRDRHETELSGKGGGPIAITWPLPKTALDE